MTLVGASSANPGFVTREMWVVDTVTGHWAETGLMSGYRGSAVGYYVFMGYQDTSGAYKEIYLTSITQNSGTTDEYKINRAATANTWQILWNGTTKTTGDTGFWSTSRIEMGGEVAGNQATAAAVTMYGSGLTSALAKVNFTSQSPTVTTGMTGTSPAVSAWTWSIP
jgi:hypothetical protein